MTDQHLFSVKADPEHGCVFIEPSHQPVTDKLGMTPWAARQLAQELRQAADEAEGDR